MTVYPMSRDDALRVLTFENRRYGRNLFRMFSCKNGSQLLKMLRTQLCEICCWDGSKLCWSDTNGYYYYEY